MPNYSKRNKSHHKSAKKQRKYEAPLTTVSETEGVGAPVEAAQPRPIQTAAPYQPRVAAKPAPKTFRPMAPAVSINYDYVSEDLKRIAIISVSLFVLLGILTFFLN